MTPIILYIETSGEICSVCIAQGENIIGIKESNESHSHAAKVAVFANELLKENNLTVKNLDAVCVSAGPGSYTGLRIGVSLAKGICYAAEIPLVAVSTLKAMASGMKHQLNKSELLFCPMIDAKRMEVYTAVYDSQNNMVVPEQPMILDATSFTEYESGKIVYFGSGAKKIKTIRPEIQEINFTVSASHLVIPCLKKFENRELEDTAYFEPNYLKPFYSPVRKLPKK
jgi:tRNA threonylcarbamoyladenosine biosynthesis protein TsaB